MAHIEILWLLVSPVLNVGWTLTLLHSEWPKLHRVLAVLSAIGLNLISFTLITVHVMTKQAFLMIWLILGIEILWLLISPAFFCSFQEIQLAETSRDSRPIIL